VELDVLPEDLAGPQPGCRGGQERRQDQDDKGKGFVASAKGTQRDDDEREDQVEGHLGGQAPRLAERRYPRVGNVDLQQCCVQEPVAQGRVGADDDRSKGDPVGRKNSGDTAQGVAGDVEPAAGVVGDQPAVQEESGQGEEDPDPEVAACPQASGQSAGRAETCEERCMGEHHQARGHGPKAVQGREASGHGRHPRRLIAGALDRTVLGEW